MSRRLSLLAAPVLALAILTACQAGTGNPGDAKEAVEAVKVDPMTAAISNPARGEKAERDGARHPGETLAFFQVEPSMTVLEISPGGGYYADILTPYLASGGGTYMATGYAETSERRIAANVQFKSNYPEAQIYIMGSEAGLPQAAADRVLTFRNTHSWMRGGNVESMFEAFYGTLKPGGMLGLVQHRLPATREQDPRAPSGYVQEAYVKQLAKEAGFEFVASSEINANPKDTADHPYGVWTLPPRLRGPEEDADAGDYDKAKYEAIGESDRMTLLFKKPS